MSNPSSSGSYLVLNCMPLVSCKSKVDVDRKQTNKQTYIHTCTLKWELYKNGTDGGGGGASRVQKRTNLIGPAKAEFRTKQEAKTSGLLVCWTRRQFKMFRSAGQLLGEGSVGSMSIQLMRFSIYARDSTTMRLINCFFLFLFFIQRRNLAGLMMT